jgi:hypothetical protein
LDCKETNYIFAVQLKRSANLHFDNWKELSGVMTGSQIYSTIQCGMEQLVARRAHNPKVVGSSPAPATKKKGKPQVERFEAFLFTFTLANHPVATQTYNLPIHVKCLKYIYLVFSYP